MKRNKILTLVACAAVIVVVAVIAMIEFAKTSQIVVADENPAVPPEEQERLAQVAPEAQLSPFTAVRFNGGTVTVTCSGGDYQLAEVDGLSASQLTDFCKQEYKDAWQKRFAEDLVVVLADLGHPAGPDHTVSLTLVDPKTGEKKTIAHALMTAENRHAVHEMLSMK